jgi:hypothetical protein
MAASSSSLVAFEGVAMFCVLLCDDVMAAAVGRKLQKGKQVHALPSALGGKHTYRAARKSSTSFLTVQMRAQVYTAFLQNFDQSASLCYRNG